MSLRSSKIIILIALFLSFLSPVLTLAASKSEIMQQVGTAGSVAEINSEIPLQARIASFIQIILETVGIVFLVLVVYGGYMLLTARGNEEKANKALSIIRPAIVGLIIILASYGITYFIVQGFRDAAFR